MDFDKAHAHHREELKNSFIHIRISVDECKELRGVSARTLQTLKTAYTEMVKHTTDPTFLFCVDSFYFQYKAFQYELENIERGVSFVNNRLYCDYYKLLNMVIKYYREARMPDSATRKFREHTLYKDLEPFREYDMSEITTIQKTILEIIGDLFNRYLLKREEIANYYKEHQVGHCISNLINTLEFDNMFLQNKIKLFMDYLAFFQISHEKHLDYCKQKLRGFCGEVNNSVNDNCTFRIDDVRGRAEELSEEIRDKYGESSDNADVKSETTEKEEAKEEAKEIIVNVQTVLEPAAAKQPDTPTSDITFTDSDDDADRITA